MKTAVKIKSSYTGKEDKVKRNFFEVEGGPKGFFAEYSEDSVETEDEQGPVRPTAPRGDRAARMLYHISRGMEKKVLQQTMSAEGYTFNPSSVFHSEYARLLKKADASVKKVQK